MRYPCIRSCVFFICLTLMAPRTHAHIDPNGHSIGSGTRQIAVQVAAANPTPIYAPNNPPINQAGPYGLANDIDGSLIIDHDNVTLYMKGHRITGDTQKGYGILIENKKNIQVCDGTIGPDIPGQVAVGIDIRNAQNVMLTECTCINSSKGILAQDSSNIRITHCTAQGHPENGFVFNNCTNCSANKSLATALTGAQDIAGFYAVSGYNNTFNSCTACAIETTGTQGQKASGIQLEMERNTAITDCTISAINAPYGSQAFGIHAPQQFTLNDQETSFQVTALSVLDYNETTGYLACSTIAGSYLTIYPYNVSSGSINPQATINYFFDTKTYLYAAAWYTDNNHVPYLAVCGHTRTAQEQNQGFIQIFQFDPQAKTLQLKGEQLISSINGSTELYALTWLTDRQNAYIAVTGKKDSSAIITLLAYNTQTGGLALRGTHTVQENGCGYVLSWYHDEQTSYIAVGGGGTNGFIKTYTYEPSLGTISPHDDFTNNLGSAVYSLSWQLLEDKPPLLAVGGKDATGYVKLFTYDPEAGSLHECGTQESNLGSAVYTVSWQLFENRIPYLIAGGAAPESGFATLYLYEPTIEKLTLNKSITIGSVSTAVTTSAWHRSKEGTTQLIIGGSEPGCITSYAVNQEEKKLTPISSLYCALATQVYSIAGCFDTHNTPYIASISNKSVYIFKYNKLTESLELHGTHTVTNSGSLSAVSWYTDAQGTAYLAVGGSEDEGAFIKIYYYDSAQGSLVLHGQIQTQGSSVNALAWAANGAPLIAASTTKSDTAFCCLSLYEYNAQSGTLTQKANAPQEAQATITSIAWITNTDGIHYLACGGGSDGFVRIYAYDAVHAALTFKKALAQDLGVMVLSVAWHKSSNGSLFLAVGGYSADSGSRTGYVHIYSYDPATNTATLLPTVYYPTNPETCTRCLAWMTDVEGSAYLTVGVDRSTSLGNPGFVVHYLFDSQQAPYLTEQWAFDTIAKPFSLFWRLSMTDAPLLAVGGGDSDPLGYLALYGIYPAGCLMRNNLIASIQGDKGVGLEASSNYNYLLGNLAYANGKNYGTDVHTVHIGTAGEPTRLANIAL